MKKYREELEEEERKREKGKGRKLVERLGTLENL
jgi:hypothetical protein